MSLLIEKDENITTISEDYNDIGYLSIPFTILARQDLTLSDKVVFSLILGFITNGKKFKASNNWIVRKTSISIRQVKDSLNKLEKLNLIKRLLGGYLRYEIVLGGAEIALGWAEIALGGSAKNAWGVVQKVDTYKLDNKQEYNIDNISKNFSEEVPNSKSKKYNTLNKLISERKIVITNLQDLYPEKNVAAAFDDFVESNQIRDYKYKDFYLALAKWIREDKFKKYSNIPKF